MRVGTKNTATAKRRRDDGSRLDGVVMYNHPQGTYVELWAKLSRARKAADEVVAFLTEERGSLRDKGKDWSDRLPWENRQIYELITALDELDAMADHVERIRRRH